MEVSIAGEASEYFDSAITPGTIYMEVTCKNRKELDTLLALFNDRRPDVGFVQRFKGMSIYDVLATVAATPHFCGSVPARVTADAAKFEKQLEAMPVASKECHEALACVFKGHLEKLDGD